MIEFLQGELAAKSPGGVTVRVEGVGFLVQTPASTLQALPEVGATVRLLTHLHLREDGISLYGFATEAERSLFRMLLGVSRVGPAVAIQVMGGCSPAEFKRHVLDGNVQVLATMAKGVGQKTARRLVAELQGTIQELDVEAEGLPIGQTAFDAIQALVALGEGRASATRAVQAALARLGSGATSQQLVEEALSPKQQPL